MFDSFIQGIAALFAGKVEGEKIAMFYLRSGHMIVVPNVKEITMTRESSTGSYAGYEIKWLDQTKAPPLLTFSIPDIVAVHVTEP